jgi:hypothetical protein
VLATNVSFWTLLSFAARSETALTKKMLGRYSTRDSGILSYVERGVTSVLERRVCGLVGSTSTETSLRVKLCLTAREVQFSK